MSIVPDVEEAVNRAALAPLSSLPENEANLEAEQVSDRVRNLSLALAGAILLVLAAPAAGAATWDYAVKVSATAGESPPRIDFSWAGDATAAEYRIYRKAIGDTAWTGPIEVLDGSAVSWTDSNLSVGDAFEYSFRKDGWPVFDTVEVSGGTAVTFTIHDAWGDGLCCEAGHGSYMVRACGVVCASGGDFGLAESSSFTVGSIEAPCGEVVVEVRPDVYGQETTWDLTEDATGDTLGRGGPYPSPRFSHIFAGIRYALPETWGTVLLLVDESVADSIACELGRLELDLIKDGYRVRRREVSSGTPVPAVKDLIVSECSGDPSITTLLILGNIAVPYSGDVKAAHADHYGAWPADLYYGELDGAWTDSYVYNTSAARSENHNVPGDGKFDQTIIPSDVDLQVGRVDLSNMPAFDLSEAGLLRRYLDKNHAFRTGQVEVTRRGIVDDNVGDAQGAAYACNGWRNFCAMFGRGKTKMGSFVPTLQTDDYLWAYGCGSSSYWACGGVASTGDYASMDFYAVFTMMFGSYFGDWDNENNVLRAPLCNAGYPLTCCWAGRPNWHLHHMALGYPIGYSTRLTQNNSDLYMVTLAGRQIHTALMGDPTLRMHPVRPPAGLALEEAAGGAVRLAWSAPEDSAVVGYNIYRAGGLYGEFTRVNAETVEDTTYEDPCFTTCSVVYMVRAVKIETSKSGTYINLSPGAIDSIHVTAGIDAARPLASFTHVTSPFAGSARIEFEIAGPGPVVLRIFDVTGRLVRSMDAGRLDAGTHSLAWDGTDAGGRRAASGIYFLSLGAGRATASGKIVLLE